MNFVEGKVKGVPLNFHRSDSPLKDDFADKLEKLRIKIRMKGNIGLFQCKC